MTHILDSKHKGSTERQKTSFLKETIEMQTYIDPFKQNNNHTRIVRKI